MEKHNKNDEEGKWNCNDCSFRGNEALELMNHLKAFGHPPIKKLDNRKYFDDYKQCYTCKMEFNGYYTI